MLTILLERGSSCRWSVICNARREGQVHLLTTPVKRRAFILGVSGIALAWDMLSSIKEFAGLLPQPRITRSTTLHTQQSSFEALWSPDSRYIVFSGGSLEVYKAKTGENITRYRGHSDEILTLEWSPDSTSIASGGFDCTVHVWNATTGKAILIYQGHNAIVRDVAWSPDGNYIASASYDKTVQIWEVATGCTIIRFDEHNEEVLTVQWSPDGCYIASTDAKNTTKVWRIN
jgi:WD40 repeat protein